MSLPHTYYRSVYHFLWLMIKPYKWYYFGMLLAPTFTAFYDLANNYSLKLVIDAFSLNDEVSYESLAVPIIIFIAANILLDVFWRTSDIMEWKSEPFVRHAILHASVNYIQHNPYRFFQNTQSGSISSRIKGILEGYDNFWAAMHHDLMPRVTSTIVLTAALAIVNLKICFLVALWAILFFFVMYRFSLRLDKLSYIHANDRHTIFGLIADNISNIFTLLSFTTRKRELYTLDENIKNTFIKSNIKVYKFNFISNATAAILYWIMLITLFLFMIYLRKNNEVSSGDVVFVMTTTLKMSWELWQTIQRMQNFMKNIGDLKSSFEVMKIPHDEREILATKELEVKDAQINFQDLDFSYGSGAIFEKFNLSIGAGEKNWSCGCIRRGEIQFGVFIIMLF